MRWMMVGVGLALAACTPAGEKLAGEKKVELDPMLAGDLTMVGTEPFWSVVITDVTKTTALTRPDAAPITAGLPERTATDTGANFAVKAADGDISIALKKAPCSDGMSDRSYPYEAIVNWQGVDLKGCAIATKDMGPPP